MFNMTKKILKIVVCIFMLFGIVNSINGENYETCITKLKEWEGFTAVPKNGCIGYGHFIKKNESYSYISKDSADRLLKLDFNKHMKFIKSNTNLQSNKLYAVSLLAYNIGVGRVLNHIKRGLLDNYQESLRYCYYRNKYIHKLYERRVWEYELYRKY